MQRAVSTPKKAIERQLSVFSVFFLFGKKGASSELHEPVALVWQFG
jgi:hypothetical protein